MLRSAEIIVVREGGQGQSWSAPSAASPRSLIQFISRTRKRERGDRLHRRLKDLHIRADQGRGVRTSATGTRPSAGAGSQAGQAGTDALRHLLPGGGHPPHQGLRPVLRGEADRSSCVSAMLKDMGVKAGAGGRGRARHHHRRRLRDGHGRTWRRPGRTSVRSCMEMFRTASGPSSPVSSEGAGRFGHRLRPQRLGLLAPRPSPTPSAPVLEIWKDVDGFMSVDPKIVPRPSRSRSCPTTRRPSWPISGPRSCTP